MRPSSLLFSALALLALIGPRAAHGDEFHLKDGSVIVGTVVGYQGNAFRVKTSYGFALVEKDKIVSIKIASAPEPADKKAKTDEPKSSVTEKSEAKVARKAADEEHAAPAIPVARAVPAPAKPPATGARQSPQPALSAANANSATAAQPTIPTGAGSSADAQSAPVAAAAPASPPEPQPIREKIAGNTYINDTYEFEMYKPPDWQIMDGARSVLPGAVAAMGTDDQSTYLVIGQEASGKSTAADIAATQKRLGEILANFRPLDDERLTISGEHVVAHRFRGSIDEYDWSGFMVFMPRGEKLYTIFGMTRADNDLVQIQENVIRRTIASFQFLPQ